MKCIKLLSIAICSLLVLSACGGDPEALCYFDESDSDIIYIDTDTDARDYPSYSMPIFSKSSLEQYSFDRTFPSCIPKNLDDPGSLPSKSSDNAAIWVKADKPTYFIGETIAAEAGVNGLDARRYSSVTAKLVADESGEVIATTTGVKIPGTVHRYRLSFEDAGEFSIDNTKRLSLVAEFEVEEHEFEVATSIEYFETIITSMDSVGTARVNAEHLEIPVYVSTTELGMHRVRANLYDAESGIPLVHLDAINDLTEASGVITLRAHIAALKVAGHEGPYILKDFYLVRMPSEPNYTTERGSIMQTSAVIPRFPFSEYDDVPYTR